MVVGVPLLALFFTLLLHRCESFYIARRLPIKLSSLSASTGFFDRIRALKEKTLPTPQPSPLESIQTLQAIPTQPTTAESPPQTTPSIANASIAKPYYINGTKPWTVPVTRIDTRLRRVALSELKVGKAYHGVVKNVIDNLGVFVDIGSLVDGLVHIADVSQIHFATNLEKRFRRGQRVTVWVKELDFERTRIKLRMYPYQGEKRYEWSDLQVKQQVNGTVVKFSEGALYVDIGGPMMAYLPRRNMRFPRGKRRYSPVEIAPFNSTQKCFIREVNQKLKRLVLTTYPPDVWHIFLPPLEAITESSRPYRGRFAEEAMLKAQRESKNRRNRPNMNNAGEGYDEDGDDEEDDEDSESFSPQQIAEVAANRGSSVLIDDFAGSDETKKRSKYDDEYQELTTKQLFKLLSDGKDHISIRDLKDWWYVRMLKKVGEWDGRKFREALAEASGGQFRLYEEHLEPFLERFAEKFGIRNSEDVQADEDEDEDEDEILVESMDDDENEIQQSMELDDSDAENVEHESTFDVEATEDVDRELDSLEELSENGDLEVFGSEEAPDSSLEDARWLFMQTIGGIDIKQAFKDLLPSVKSRTVKLQHLLEWVVCKQAFAAQIISNEDMPKLFRDCTSGKPSMKQEEFVDFVKKLTDFAMQSFSYTAQINSVPSEFEATKSS